MCLKRASLPLQLIPLLAVVSLFLPSEILAQSVIAAGTEVVTRTSENIDSRNVDLSREYVAVLDEPIIIVDGTVLAPKGAEAVLRVAQANQAGAVSGRASLTLQLIGVTINGRRIPVVTEGVKSESGSQAGRTAKTAAGGAAIGAIIGGILGGAQGAAQGAAIGGAAGVGAAVVAGERIQVPAETRLTFVLQQQASLVSNSIDVLIHNQLGSGQLEENLRVRIGTLEGTFQLNTIRPKHVIRFPLLAGQRYTVALSGDLVLGGSGSTPQRMSGEGSSELIVMPNQHYRVVGDFSTGRIRYDLEACSLPCE